MIWFILLQSLRTSILKSVLVFVAWLASLGIYT
jgi:hypothetical protein